MNSNVTWEPIEDHEELVGMGFDAIFGPRPDGTLTLFVEVPNDAGAGELTLPPDVRLCRATKVAEAPPLPWSQEPPDAPGDWWVWHAGGEERMVYPYAVRWEVRKGRYVFVMPDDSTAELSDMPPDTWYAPATVPQPPGEVGP